MERLESEHLDADVLLRMEHRHRYMWAAGYACGDVCDLACGYGYGAEVLAANQLVNSYVGIDASAEAIVQANQRFAADARRYLVASATDIPLADQSIDTVVSLETLEHLLEPSLALMEFKRILRPEGVLVGSVPSKYFDDRAEDVYGKNPYHVTRFTYAELVKLLGKYFSTFRVYYSALEVVTRIGTLVGGHPTHVETTVAIRNRADDEVSGSFHFVASNRHWPDIDNVHESRIYFCVGLTDFDAVRVVPLQNLIKQNEQLVTLKDKHLRSAEELLRLKDEHLRSAEELIRQKDEHLRRAEEIILQRDQEITAIPRTVAHWIKKYLRIGAKNQRVK
jgi:ubiquinone/menaquinone biosynthesis C-methylase UbiE